MLTIQVDGTLEQRLKQAAADAGDEPAMLARQVLDLNLPVSVAPANAAAQLSAIESFIAGMSAWVSKNVPAGNFADDDRASPRCGAPPLIII